VWRYFLINKLTDRLPKKLMVLVEILRGHDEGGIYINSLDTEVVLQKDDFR
jgi:hypothetical protein